MTHEAAFRMRAISNELSLANMSLHSAQSANEHGRHGTYASKIRLTQQALARARAEADALVAELDRALTK